MFDILPTMLIETQRNIINKATIVCQQKVWRSYEVFGTRHELVH